MKIVDLLFPHALAVQAAVQQALLSPCRSQRGAVVFRIDLPTVAIDGRGHNRKPAGFDCDGTEACKSTCRDQAVHAEQVALLDAGDDARDAELLHVKVVGGALVASGGPSCLQCSKLALAAGVAGVWLYHDSGWRRYSAPEFHRLSLAAVCAAPTHDREVAIAERIARWAHDGQLDRATRAPYITHVERVVAMVDGDEARAIAWLHDVVEDNSSWPLEALALAGISPRVIEAVRLLTRTAPFNYAQHIEHLAASGDALAIAVKVADLRDHLQPNCPATLRPRYEWALKLLTASESAPE